MRYLILIGDPTAGEEMLTAPVGSRESAYIRDEAFPQMEPLSDEEYIKGPLAILATGARSSYVLCDSDVLWCVEWPPGLLVIRFSPSGDMRWCSLRSPVPNFAGRSATDEELDRYDENQPNPQYAIVFDAWDAQFEPERREHFEVASSNDRIRWQSAMLHAERLGEAIMKLSTSDPVAFERWRRASEESKIWRGEQRS